MLSPYKTKEVSIKKNTPELRKKLEELGYIDMRADVEKYPYLNTSFDYDDCDDYDYKDERRIGYYWPTFFGSDEPEEYNVLVETEEEFLKLAGGE